MEENMPQDIRTEAEYRSLFPDNVIKTAYKTALDTRKFEIDLYWKRAGYFWTLIAAAFAAYFVLWSKDKPNYVLIFIVSCIGLLLSISWFLVNRGSKYWQENWERHVDLLEQTIAGPLYKTTISKEEYPMFSVKGGYPYSVSKINQSVSMYIATLWLGLAIGACPLLSWKTSDEKCAIILLLLTTIIFIGYVLFGCLGGSEGKGRNINFKVSHLVNTK
jgi:hypothetical protein